MAGGLWVYFIGQAFPQFVFDPLFDLAVVLMAFFGGLGTVAGPVLGALVLEPAQLYLTLQLTNGYESRSCSALLFLVVIVFLPRGVLPTAAELLARARSAASARPGCRGASGRVPPAGSRRPREPSHDRHAAGRGRDAGRSAASRR